MIPILPKIRHEPQVRKSSTKKHTTTTAVNPAKTHPILPKLLVLLGLILVLSQGIPLAWSMITGATLSASSSGFMPVTDSFLKTLTHVAFVDPGAEYFESVISQAKEPLIDTSYKKNMRISIPKAGINDILLTPNVVGNNASIYDEVLKHGVAQLKGTSVPGDPGTSVIYGHSGIGGLLAGRNNPQIIFSRLDGVSIGDTMSIQRDGKEIRYVVSGKKIVDPEDLSFLSEENTPERAVLLTCWPLGIGTRRLIIIADKIQ